MQKIAIIIPCYNEEKRLKEALLTALIEGCQADIYLANDGSTDHTLDIIEGFSKQHPNRCFVIHYPQNQGKANTIFKAANALLENDAYSYIGYFDADFSTPPSEIIRLVEETQKHSYQFLFGSRILLLNSGIQRKFYRHIIGRIIITMINVKFSLGIYDTQCGSKIFSKEIIREAFAAPFYTSWLFDVEIFVRLKKRDLLKTGREIPIYNWKDIEGSKLGWKTGFKILKELYLLTKNY